MTAIIKIRETEVNRRTWFRHISFYFKSLIFEPLMVLLYSLFHR